MKRRIKINTTFEEDEQERRDFFVALSYSERLRYYFKLRNMVNFHREECPKGKIFIIHKAPFLTLLLLCSTVFAHAQINTPLKHELDSLYALDQKYRALTSGKRDSARTDSLAKVYKVSPADLSTHLWKLQNEADSAGVKRVEAIIKQYGYPGKTLVGEPTNQAAFFILQHSTKIGAYIDIVKVAAEKQELPFNRYAMMQDRWLMYNNREQVYGTQLKGMNVKNPETGKIAWKFFIWPIADPQRVNQRRQRAGIEKSMEEYANSMGLHYKVYTLDDVRNGKIE